MARPVSGRVTVRAVAAEAGVSIATVSRVMNGHLHVAGQTRELVQQALDRLGAPPPARPGSGAVYLRCPYVLTDYFGLIVSSIAETLALHGRRLVLDAGEASQHARVLPSLPQDPAIAGAILILPPEPSEELEALHAQGFPFVVVDPRTRLSPDIASISAANVTGARARSARR